MEVDWLLLGCRAVALWNTQLGSRHRMPWRRSATRISWDDSYTFAKTERPSLVSATRLPHAEASKAAPALCAVDSKDRVASAAPLEEHQAVEAGRSMLPTFVPPNLLRVTLGECCTDFRVSYPTTSAGKI
jgi:hypothetical protein